MSFPESAWTSLCRYTHTVEGVDWWIGMWIKWVREEVKK
jgi:hypothetical protein